MRGINEVILIGNATRDAELRHTTTGKPVSSIRLATNRKVGEHEETQFHSVVCWEGLAETTSNYAKKGDPLSVEGRLPYCSFQDEEGKERGVCEVVASDVQFLGHRRDGVNGASPTGGGPAPATPIATMSDTGDRSPEPIPF